MDAKSLAKRRQQQRVGKRMQQLAVALQKMVAFIEKRRKRRERYLKGKRKRSNR